MQKQINTSEKIGTLKDKEKVQVVFTNEVYKKMMALVNKASKEVGWYGSARRESDKRFVIYDIYLPPQKVTGATVETDDEEYALWSAGLTDEQFTNMKFFGHSHVYMGVTPSGVDTRKTSCRIPRISISLVFLIKVNHGGLTYTT